MNRVKNRTIAALLFVVMITAGLSFYVYSYINEGSEWASFRANKTVYSNGRVVTGTILDRNGVLLASSENGVRTYNDDPEIRKATLHVVGDKNGNIGTSLMNKYASELTGFDIISGSYKIGDGDSVLKSTIDAEINKAACEALGDNRGAVVVYDYQKGDIVCLVSSQSFDPMNPPDLSGNDPKYEGVYLNRAISGAYIPGSIFKVITTAAALENLEGIETETFICEGTYKVGNNVVTCQGGTAHGKIDLATALAKSCNCTFAQISLRLRSKNIGKYADLFGLTSSVKMGNISTASGKFDVVDTNDISVAWSGIGQSTDLVNPIAMMRAMGAVANNGIAVEPRLLMDGTSDKNRMISTETALKLQKLMANNVTVNYGEDNYPGLKLCAKSGTAEVGGNAQPHAWFTGFIQNEDAPLAFVVIIENGGSGSKNAGAVANKVLQAAVERYEKR